MPSFRVDPIEVARATKYVRQSTLRALPLHPRLEAVAPAAAATGDGSCAASFVHMIGVWADDFLEALRHQSQLVLDLAAAQTDYVEVEAAIADVPVFRISLEGL